VLVDSTLGYNLATGFRCGTSLPHEFFDFFRRRGLPLLSAPLALQDVAVFSPRGHGCQPSTAKILAGTLLDRVARAGGCLTILFHPDRLVDPRYEDLYRWVLDEALRQGAWACSLEELRDWWSVRAGRLDA
jgi:hypothetical protein